MTNIRTGAAILVSAAGLSLIGALEPTPALAYADSSLTSTPNQDSVFAKQNQDFYRLLTEPDQDHPMVIWNFPLVRSQGIAACQRQDAGETPHQALKDLQYPNGPYAFDEANDITSAAEVIYCPWHGASASDSDWANTSAPVDPRPVYPAFSLPAAADIGLIAVPSTVLTSPIPLVQCPPGFYSNSSGNCVERPDQNPINAIAVCCDGTNSHSQHRSGTCSGHGGVCQWNSFSAAHPDNLDERSAGRRADAGLALGSPETKAS